MISTVVAYFSSLSAVRSAPALAVGDTWMLHALWHKLGWDEAFRRVLRNAHGAFDAERLLRAMVFNRRCAPESTLGVLRWLDTVAMPDVPEGITHDQLLRAMDALMERVEAVEAAVARQLRPLLDDALSVVFYDLTTIRISGRGTVADDARAYGLSKDTGGIARQFVLGVIQTAQGLPIAHQVHASHAGRSAVVRLDRRQHLFLRGAPGLRPHRGMRLVGWPQFTTSSRACQ